MFSRILFVSSLLVMWVQGQNQIPNVHQETPQASLAERYGNVPLAFEINQGQSDPSVRFLARGADYALFLTSDEIVLTTGSAMKHGTRTNNMSVPNPSASKEPDVLRIKLLGGGTPTDVAGLDELPGKSNYFVGNDSRRWKSSVPQYGRVRYENVYPKIDLIYYGRQRKLEYDFVIQPGADPNVIRLGIRGAKSLRIDHEDLVLDTPHGEILLPRPQVYQQVKGARKQIDGRYVLKGEEVGFNIPKYDRSKTLVIDPVIAYSSYLGGSGLDFVQGFAVDSAGNAYVTGYTGSSNFPLANPIQTTNHGNEAFVTKINADGTALLYSTYLGGSGDDRANDIGIDTAGNAYVVGGTGSPDFPILNALQPGLAGVSDAFVTKIDGDGHLVFSTYLGGATAGPYWQYEDVAYGVAIGPKGNVYVTGGTGSSDFPVVNAIQRTLAGPYDAFVTKINSSGTAILYSTYLGGSSEDYGKSIAIDGSGEACVLGATHSIDFTTVNAVQPAPGGTWDGFVVKINSSGNGIVYSTYLGGNSDDVQSGSVTGGYNAGGDLAADTAGNVYIIGSTFSTDFPVVNAI